MVCTAPGPGVVETARSIFAALGGRGVDVIVAETGDGIMGEYGVQDILLVSSLYDAFTLQEDGRLNELVMREFDPQGGPNLPVPDPFYGGTNGFEEVYLVIERSVRLVRHQMELAGVSLHLDVDPAEN